MEQECLGPTLILLVLNPHYLWECEKVFSLSLPWFLDCYLRMTILISEFCWGLIDMKHAKHYPLCLAEVKWITEGAFIISSQTLIG